MQNVDKENKRKSYAQRLKQELAAAKKQARIDRQARLEEAQRRKKLEREMREVFGIPVERRAKPVNREPSWFLLVSARKVKNGAPYGSTFVKEFRYPTISKFDAEFRARKELREASLELWVILESKKEDQ